VSEFLALPLLVQIVVACAAGSLVSLASQMKAPMRPLAFSRR